MTEKLRQMVKAGNVPAVIEELDSLMAKGQDPRELLEAMIGSLREVGDAFSRGDAFIPEMLIAAKAMQAGADHLGPRLPQKAATQRGKLMIATVQGDLHDVGKNLVALVFKGNGFEVKDLGVDVAVEKLISAYEEERPDLVGLSALLTTTMVGMEKTVQALKEKHPEAKVLVGGAPVTQEFADGIKADGYAPDAGAAVQVALALLKGE